MSANAFVTIKTSHATHNYTLDTPTATVHTKMLQCIR